MSLSARSPQDPAGNWRLWSSPSGHQSQLLESRLVTAQGAPKGTWVEGGKRATGMEGWTIEWMGRGWGGPKAWTLRVGLMIQGLKPEAEDWGGGVQANQGKKGVKYRL